jgi:hypothetical protein
LRKSIFAVPIESISKARNVPADEANTLHSLLADCEARRAEKDARITCLFLQRSEPMNTLAKADPAPAKRLSGKFATVNDEHHEGKRLRRAFALVHQTKWLPLLSAWGLRQRSAL